LVAVPEDCREDFMALNYEGRLALWDAGLRIEETAGAIERRVLCGGRVRRGREVLVGQIAETLWEEMEGYYGNFGWR
jgi:hypothetical protein